MHGAGLVRLALAPLMGGPALVSEFAAVEGVPEA